MAFPGINNPEIISVGFKLKYFNHSKVKYLTVYVSAK